MKVKITKKTIALLLMFLLAASLSAKGENKIDRKVLKLNATIDNKTESIEVSNTDMINIDTVNLLKISVNDHNNKNEKKKKIGKNIKTKGGPGQEIYRDYSDSVVLVGTDSCNYIGTGFVIKHLGKKVITNWHVIEDAKSIGIWLKPKKIVDADYLCRNQDSYVGKIVKINRKKDLAMIDVVGLPGNIKTISLGSTKSLNVGETVHAIGHPKGLTWSYSDGRISQFRANYRWAYDSDSRHQAKLVIQTTTDISSGNSGGPLFNKHKKLIGVMTYTQPDGQGLNFAVSTEDLIEFINEVQKKDIDNKYIKKRKKKTWIKKKKKSKKKKITSNYISKKYPKVKEEDKNNNGIADTWYIDEDQNGKYDKVYVDFDEDGLLDASGYDENENGNYEVILYDDNKDGSPDRADIDEDDNGTTDIIAYDYNQDGEWDKYEKVS